MTYRPELPILSTSGYSQPVTSLAFDPVSDTLWAGDTSGYVVANYGAPRMRGVSYLVGRGDPVKKIIASEVSVHACSNNSLGTWGKGGVNKWYHQAQRGIVAFDYHPNKPHTLVLAQTTPEFVLLNSTTGAVLRTSPAPSVVTALRASHSVLLSGAADGYLRTHDIRVGGRTDTDASESSVLAHVGGVQSIDIAGNYALTMGWGMRQSRPHPDPLVKVFDVRMLRPLAPLQFPSGAAFINAHPKHAGRITITSAEGLVNVIDIAKAGDGGEFYQIDLSSYITSVAISPTSGYMAFGDAEGTVHILTSTAEDEHVPFNGFDGKAVEWANTAEPLQEIAWDEKTPLNSIGMPHYDTELLSYYDHPLLPSTAEVPPPQKIPAQVLASVRVQDKLQYAMLPKELRGQRNVVKSMPTKKQEGRFRSERSKHQDEEPRPPTTFDPLHPEVPVYYHRTAIAYSKFGVEDFDFYFYNRTTYSGLETDIPNSYANSLIQILHHSIPIRRLAKSHITTSCRTEHCLLCEFGFVARMLEDACGINLQARNFCMTIGRKASAQSFGLIDRSVDGENSDYSSMIQQLNRFVLEEFALEGNAFPRNPRLIEPSPTEPSSTFSAAPITQLLGLDAKTVTVCSNCGFQRDKDLMSHVVDLVYPRKVLNEPAQDLTSVLRTSLERDITYKSTCQVCKHLSIHRSRRILSSQHMPPVLTVNAAVNNDDHLRFWGDTLPHPNRFLKSRVSLPMRDSDGILHKGSAESVTYDLRGYVSEIRMGGIRHLVAVIRTPFIDTPEPEEEGSESGEWYIFNDFVVRKIPEHEALSFPGKWKVPCVLYFERSEVLERIDYSGLPQNLDPEILGQTVSLAAQVNWTATKQTVLGRDELPRPGTIVSIDAEFVALQQEVSEIRSDGTKKVLKPSQMSLARVSVIRGSGPKFGVPFIDDYIHTSDTIVDYLTEYSGIQPGDLHPAYSTHVLLPLKVVYKKLRLLIDLGCVFVGHGLSKDFRIINIFVPPSRVVDTVDLWFIRERHRRLSLRFLSYCVLKEEIQVDTHDSIEDARAALLLYRKYREFQEEDTFHEALQAVYAEGKRLGFKIPEQSRAATPSTPAVTPFVPQRQRIEVSPLQPSKKGNSTSVLPPTMHASTLPPTAPQPGMLPYPGLQSQVLLSWRGPS